MNHNRLSAKGEQRENVQSQHLSTGNVSGVGIGCLNTFVIWRSAQEELHRSAPLSKIYSTFSEKIHVFTKSYHSFLLRQGPACSLCWIFSVENPSLSTSPLLRTSQRHPKYLMPKLKHLYQKNLIKSYTEFYGNLTDFSWVMWM